LSLALDSNKLMSTTSIPAMLMLCSPPYLKLHFHPCSVMVWEAKWKKFPLYNYVPCSIISVLKSIYHYTRKGYSTGTVSPMLIVMLRGQVKKVMFPTSLVCIIWHSCTTPRVRVFISCRGRYGFSSWEHLLLLKNRVWTAFSQT
jgi:hypothetical protein